MSKRWTEEIVACVSVRPRSRMLLSAALLALCSFAWPPTALAQGLCGTAIGSCAASATPTLGGGGPSWTVAARSARGNVSGPTAVPNSARSVRRTAPAAWQATPRQRKASMWSSGRPAMECRSRTTSGCITSATRPAKELSTRSLAKLSASAAKELRGRMTLTRWLRTASSRTRPAGGLGLRRNGARGKRKSTMRAIKSFLGTTTGPFSWAVRPSFSRI